jgi:hypothetical protein
MHGKSKNYIEKKFQAKKTHITQPYLPVLLLVMTGLQELPTSSAII